MKISLEVRFWYGFIFLYLYGDLLVVLKISNQVVKFCSMQNYVQYCLECARNPLFYLCTITSLPVAPFSKKTILEKIMVRDSNNIIVLVLNSTEV